MTLSESNFGAIDNRFLSQSVGLLNPHHPISIDDTASVKETLQLLQDNKIGCIVLTNKEGKVSGIFSERDVVLKIILKDISLGKTPISEFMTKEPKTATMTTTIAFALNMMSSGGYRHVPIVDDESFPIGIISVKDIVDHLSGTILQDLKQN